MFAFFLISFSLFFSLTIASHFLGGSFTYRHIDQPINSKEQRSVLVELRFHISDHYFICTPDQVNEHLIVYLIGETVPYDNLTNTYRWNETQAVKHAKDFYDIQCTSEENNACERFQEQTWAYCESANQKSGYSILRRQFLFIVERFRPIHLLYSTCCWANSSNIFFYFHLSIETKLSRNNSSPYPHIPASYYVDIKNPRDIKIFVYDADGDDVICNQYEHNFGNFLTVYVDNSCKLTYQRDRIGKQFGQFWLMDRNRNQTLSRALISIQVHVLENIICNTQPEIIVKNKVTHSYKSIIKTDESVYISVSLKPNCLSIEPQDQTITELTTLCANNQPVVLANGGIEVLFQCTPYLCEKYQVCFVGEFGLKLPSTEIECVLIEVIDTKEKCSRAVKNYDFLKPRNRHFVTSDPMEQSLIGTTRRKSAKSTLFRTETTITTKTTLPAKSRPRRWLWILISLFFVFLLGSVAYLGFKQILLPQLSNGGHLHPSNRDGSFSTVDSHVIATYPDTKQTDSPVTPYNQYDISQGSPATTKVRSQHLRLGPFDEDN